MGARHIVTWLFAIILLCLPCMNNASPLDLEARQAGCPTGAYIIAGPGKGAQLESKNGKLQPLVDRLRQSIPGTPPTNTLKYDLSLSNSTVITIGTSQMTAAVRNQVAKCPNTPIIILGFSVGGIIGMNTLCGGLTPNYSDNVIAAIFYGEETFNYPKSYDRGTCRRNAPRTRQRGNACSAFESDILSYCDAQDPLCCLGGTDRPSHKNYPVVYDDTNFNFIMQQYRLYRLLHPLDTIGNVVGKVIP